MEVIEEIKSEFKDTKLGLVPQDWEIIKFKELADDKVKWSLTGGPFGSDLKSEHYTEEGVRVIQLQNLGDGVFIQKGFVYTSNEKADSLLACNIFPDEIILAKMGDPVTRACIIPKHLNNRYLMGSDGIRLVPDEIEFDKLFVKEYINFSIFRTLAMRHSTGSTRQRIGLTDLKKLPFIKPQLKEQQRIASILSAWNLAIETTQSLIDKLQTRKKGLMQQLLTGKLRLNRFSDEWSQLRGGDIFANVTDKKHDGTLEVLSATQDKGVIPRNETGIDIKYSKSSLSNYKRLAIGDFVISLRSFQGGIEYSEYDGIVSPAYTVLREKLAISKLFYREYMKTENFISRLNSIIYGIRDGKQISYKEFSSLKFVYPTVDEQNAIASVIQTADIEIQQYLKYLEQLQKQKKGLMQQLLTGQIRVKV